MFKRQHTMASFSIVGITCKSPKPLNHRGGHFLLSCLSMSARLHRMNGSSPARIKLGLAARILIAMHIPATCCIAASPIARPDSVTMHHLQKASIPVLHNDTAATAPVVQQAPRFGIAAPDSYGRILYTHTTGTPDTDSFTYRAANASGQSSPVTVTINFATRLRLPNPDLNVPSAPPRTSYQIVDAFASLMFSSPVCMATPPSESKRLFVCEKAGLLRLIPKVNSETPQAITFLDLPKLLNSRGESISTGGEQGLLGLAFHPNYASNRYFYIFYSVTKKSATYERVSRFTTRSDNPNLADTSSEVILIEQIDQASNHNGGDLHFGPDGYLYISLGDEGTQDDSLNNSQKITKDFFSAILRVDVDKKAGNLEPRPHPNPAQSDPAVAAVKRYETAPGSGIFRAAYSIPLDNPFVSTDLGGSWNGKLNNTTISGSNKNFVRSEIWALGFRNPWRMSFDSATGELWVGDVGGNMREEIDIPTRGANYGWNFREGFIARPGSGTPPSGFASIDPIYDYPHTSETTADPDFKGNSIIGGFVYRGTRLSNLAGAYVFADYVSGNLWSLRRNPAAPPTVERIGGETGITAFGKDPSNGDILMANLNRGSIRRLIGSTPSGNFPATLGATGLFADLSDLSPNPGLLPYQVNLPFWSDHAVKRHWFIIPDPTQKMKWSRNQPWTYPTGQIWVKHFDLPLTRSNPPSPTDPTTPSKRLETRILVKTSSGVYGVSYRWNQAGTEATLVPESGADFDVHITRNGNPYTQRWHIPSRSECSSCHTPQAGYSLSMTTRQLNLVNTINGFHGNQLNLLKNGNFFSNSPESPNVLPHYLAPDDADFPLEARVRSYLAVNCSYCHQAGGTASPATWDGRPQLTLAQTGILNGMLSGESSDSMNRLIVPGDLLHSVIYNRVATSNGFTRMPPIATSELDQKNIALLRDWITKDLPTRKSSSPLRNSRFLDAAATAGVGDEPHVTSSFIPAAHGSASCQFKLNFDARPESSIQVETSTNLRDWELWDVEGNHGMPQSGNITLQSPTSTPQRYFRLKISDP